MNIEHYKASAEATDADERALIPAIRRTTNKAQHSPLPWTALVGGLVTIGIPGRGAIATLGEKDREGGLHLSPEIAEANAKLIVHAVNHADKLAEASKTLAMLALQSERYTNDAEYRDATDKVLHNVRAYESEAQ